MRQFEPGQTIEMREVWDGKTWEQRTAVVVEDGPGLIALYTPPKSEALVAVSRDGRHLRMPTEEWSLEPTQTFDSGVLGLHVPGTQHSVLVIFNPPPGYAPWYINLESDLQRTERGFEYEEHVLDIVVEATSRPGAGRTRTSWRRPWSWGCSPRSRRRSSARKASALSNGSCPGGRRTTATG